MRSAFLILATLAIAAPARFAFGVDAATEEARQHFLKGQQLFELTRWDEAAEEFEKAYAARSDPTFIYNMAQAYRRKGDAKRAFELYKNYLIKAPKSPQRPEVEERIATLQKQIEEAERAAKAAASAPAGAPAATPGAAPTAPVPAAAPAPVLSPTPAAAPANLPPTFPAQGYAPSPAPAYAPTPAPAMAPSPVYAPIPAPAPTPAYVTATASAPAAESSPGKGLRTGGIVCGAAGVAFIGAGIFFGLEAQAYARTVEKGSIFNPNYDDRGKLYAKLQWVGYGVGGGLLATGAVLYGLGLRGANSPTVALVPTVMSGGAGLSAGGTY